MDPEVIDGAAPAGTSEPGNPAAAQTNAATTAPATGAGEGGEEGQAAPKTFTQQELDEIVKKRVAKAEDRAERRVLRTLEKLTLQQSQQQTQAHQSQEEQRPTRRQGETDDAYFSGPYTHVEVGFPSAKPEPWTDWETYSDGGEPTETVYGYVPVEMVTALVESHGGEA